MNERSWAATIRLVHERANYRCEYCRTSQWVIGQPMHVEHIEIWVRAGEHPPDDIHDQGDAPS